MLTPAPLIDALDPASFGRNLDRLAQILQACVREGASVGFVLPFGQEEARAYWRDKVAPPLEARSRLVLAATVGGEVVGTAQLDLDGMPSKLHHAEVSKVLVDPGFRRTGVARALITDIERRAAEAGRWLLTLDTAGDAAEALYRSIGYTLAGTIPLYARDAFEADRYDATRLMYKDLREAWASKFSAPLISGTAERGGEPQPDIVSPA
jgi:ribosomal protein S18 acetylase RimI-like enzyme